MAFTVLVVDGEQVDVKPVASRLARHYQVVKAVEGGQARSVLARERVDVVVFAVRTEHGLSELAVLRSTRPSLPVIVIGATRDAALGERSLRLGAAQYLAKPFDEDRLLDVIASAARHRRAEQGQVVLVASPPETFAVLDVVLREEVDCVTVPLAEIVSGRNAYDAAQLVVLDVDGAANALVPTVRALRAQRPRLAIIALTGDVAGTRSLCARSLLAVERVVAKPYRLDQLLDHIGAVLATSGEPLPRWRRFPLPLVEAIHYIAEHYPKSLTTEDIALAGRRSASRLTHLFTDVLGVSVHAFINRVRVEVARSLLAGSRRPLADIAEDVGFSDASHLSRVFTCCEGVRPGEYRRQASRVGSGRHGRTGMRETLGAAPR